MRSLSEFLLKRKQKSVQRKVKAFNLKAAQSAFLLYNATDVNQGLNENEEFHVGGGIKKRSSDSPV